MISSVYPTYTRLLELKEFPGLEALGTDLIYLMGVGNFKQFCSTLRGILDAKEYCPFCEVQARGRRILSRTNAWYLCENDFPKQGMTMRLIIPKRHVTSPHDLSSSDWPEIGVLFARECSALLGGGLIMRFGDPLYHAGTVPHLHINIISPNPIEEYRASLSKDLESRHKNFARLCMHRMMLENRGGLNWLFSDDCDEFLNSE